MTLTANIELLIAHLKAEISVLEARLQSVLHQVKAKAEEAGVEMPTAPANAPAPEAAPTVTAGVQPKVPV